MADMGADIIKVEPPSGDFLRAAPPMRDDASAYLGALNCGRTQRSVLIYNNHEGIEIIKRCARGRRCLVGELSGRV